MDKGLKLVLPSKEYLDSYIIAGYEEKAATEYVYGFNNPENDDIFEKFERYRLGVNLPSDRVQSSTFWLVENGEFIAESSVRHHLNDSLMQYGGHIGYGVRPSKWRMGYGTIVLEKTLIEAKKLGISRALITCDNSNTGSARVIEKNGGVLENKVKNTVEGKEILTRRYWIDIN